MNIVKCVSEIIDHIILSITIIGKLFFIGSILSIDNAAMIDSMIVNFRKEDRKKRSNMVL